MGCLLYTSALLRHLDGVGHAVEQRYGTLVLAALGIGAVSYTHLDVYKRQVFAVFIVEPIADPQFEALHQ